MKTVFILSVLFTGFLILSGCDEDESSDIKDYDRYQNTIGWLSTQDGVLVADSSYINKILEKLQAERIDSFYYLLPGEILGDTVDYRFYVLASENPYIFSLTPLYDSTTYWVDSTFYFTQLRIYKNAQCGKFHPGFVSDCIGTFGNHKFWGNSMQWTVRDWYSCTSGDSICIESYNKVGEIRYYNSGDCLDSFYIPRPIYEWECIN